MKITILGTAYPYRGGLAAFNERLSQEFVNEGDDVTIETFTLQYPNFLFPGKTQYSSENPPQNLQINRSVSSINPFNWISVGQKIRKAAPDILIIKFWLPFMAPCFGTIARIAKKNGKTKVISILDNIIPHEKRIADKILSNYFVGAVDSFIAMSKSVLSDLNIFDTQKPRCFCAHPLYDNFGQRITRSEALQKLNLKEENSYILFFGFIRDYKGLDLLIEAMADKKMKNSNIKLLVAGEFYNNSDKYFELEKKLDVADKIIWHNDFIPDSQVATYFSAADIIVQPYKSATQSGVTQIAYHFEKPMLVTNVGGLAEIVPHQKVGYVVEPQPSEIVNAITDFYENNREQDFITNVKIEKEKYAWSRMTESIKNFVK
ncbi:MAG: glycosyltransferase [Bacteroidales bacterium]|nr:glycosyltransferase [Bacteroidales bacterium]